MPLPTQKTPPKTSLSDITALIYGPSKIGKSEFCSKLDGALFLASEPGLNHLEVYQEPIGSWERLLEKCREIADGNHSFETVILDTADTAYRLCAEYVCNKHRVDHESDLEYGKGWALVNNEFQRVLTKLAGLGYGLWLVSHSQEKELETRTGKLTKIVPTLPARAREVVIGLVDLILFCDVEMATGEDGQAVVRRVIRTKPSAHYEAGDRTKRLPETIDLDHPAFVAAWNGPLVPNLTPPPIASVSRPRIVASAGR